MAIAAATVVTSD